VAITGLRGSSLTWKLQSLDWIIFNLTFVGAACDVVFCCKDVAVAMLCITLVGFVVFLLRVVHIDLFLCYSYSYCY
jgi:hypothetical protein